jgi:hypothetical protein
MAWLDFLNNQYTYLLLFEVFVTFVSFGVFLGYLAAKDVRSSRSTGDDAGVTGY